MYRFIVAEGSGRAVWMRVICDRCGLTYDARGATEIFSHASRGWAKGPDLTDLCPGCARSLAPPLGRKEGHADH